VACSNPNEEQNQQSLNLTFKCDEPLPEFTLAPNSNPTSDEIESLCSCIWETFPDGGWERETSNLIIMADKSPEIEEIESIKNFQAFLPRFGKAIDNCGGYNL
tara:strand:+ start:862 stop:1170 length:309 start_codon:yes stop_codon:yes gene_type:complete